MFSDIHCIRDIHCIYYYCGEFGRFNNYRVAVSIFERRHLKQLLANSG